MGLSWRKILYLLLVVLIKINCSQSLIRRRFTRDMGGTNVLKSVSAPLLGDEIDLETVEGIEQVTKLVLIKTNTHPGEYDERIDGSHLSSLMETLYTGLRKPFKSVSADILGIFPSFEEIQVQCEKPSTENLEKDESITIKRTIKESNTEPDISYVDQESYKSSLQVCRAVTNDCLSMEDLVKILPPSLTTFDQALVRLCPIILFRIMNHQCHKTISSITSRDEGELISTYEVEKMREEVESSNKSTKKSPIAVFGSFLRESNLLKSLQNSDELGPKKPQKLHKKLKTQTSYKTNGRLTTGSSQRHGSVDEQLLKIRLKLTEPSIEKVWIFSMLFVILSIVVSMGGLIVLPFVKRTTRRRILTLFEGLAVGGLAGSATLHMFPQAFGLVDENYRKYFWRIFVVFFGIYLCYLCERIIKILKVMRARKRRRSRASLIDMDFCYGFPSVSREISRNRLKSSGVHVAEFDGDSNPPCYLKKKKYGKRRKQHSTDLDSNASCQICLETKYLDKGSYKSKPKETDTKCKPQANNRKQFKNHSSHMKKERFEALNDSNLDETLSTNNPTDIESSFANSTGVTNPTRQRLVQCLKSVQRQFSPVYAVQTQYSDGAIPPKDEPRAGRLMRLASYSEGGKKIKKNEKISTILKKGKAHESRAIFGRVQKEKKTSMKKYLKQRDVETMLYHQRMIGNHGRGEATLDRGYLQQRLSTVHDIAAERQDQDNAARMSVDTVAWMIVFGDAVLNVIDGLSIGAAFERNILAGISISVAVMLEEVTHRLGTFAVLIRAGMSMQQSLLCTFLSACALFPGLIVGILLSDATEDATPYIFCAAGGIFLYMALVDVMKEMNRSIENAMRKDIKSTLQIFALQNIGIIVAVIFLSFLALYEQAMDFEEYQMQYNQPS